MKQSILQRKSGRERVTNQTSVDKEFQTEERKVQARANRNQELHDHRRVALFGSPEEKNSMKRQLMQQGDYLKTVKNEVNQHAKKRELETESQMNSYNQQMMFREEMGRQRKREQMKQIQEDNRRRQLMQQGDYLKTVKNEVNQHAKDMKNDYLKRGARIR
eukprot:CAMPEP_0115021170 /NCGR_PEP_ID=MMETSP0216-20121206/30705_1 /TAXON_ID=223996 /ORGANISM="Protocruzia adherens, Strain Boccale" /LENGTH=160 /DNA_ID=CAMNT_0002393431 /DNA_START=81 /DNA_END=563 /DNA_ORIENTATION=+